MLSLRLPPKLESEFIDYCKRHELTNTDAVIAALHKLLRPQPEPLPLAPGDPFEKWVGSVKSGMTTDELMRMTRGDDWNQP